MKPNRIYAGTWVPRTQLHLEEFHHFLTGKFDLLDHLDRSHLKKLLDNLDIKGEIHYQQGGLDTITTTMGPYDFHLLEDGTILISKQVHNLQKDSKKTAEFFLNHVITAFDYVFSRGAPIPKVFTDINSILPLIITIPRASEERVVEIFNQYGSQILNQVHDSQVRAYYGQDITILVGPTANEVKLIRYLLFIQEHKSQLSRLLRVHRVTWEKITSLRQRRWVQYKDLPAMRDELLEVRQDISYFDARLGQLDTFLTERKRVLNEYIPRKSLQNFVNSELSSLLASQKYLLDLWRMTAEYADSTQNLVAMLYQDNEHKEINMLQIIFIIGAIANLISLGAMPSAQMITTDATGNLLSVSNIQNFNLMTLIRYGSIALMIGVIIYYTLHFLFTRLKSIRIISKPNSAAKHTTLKKYLSM